MQAHAADGADDGLITPTGVTDTPATPQTPDATRNHVGGIFVLTILLGSFLLFLVQPMIARMALPKLGGAPAVWNSAMLVYQALLLCGYAYAHFIGRFAARYQAAIHLTILAVAALWLPIGLMAMHLPADAAPVLWVPWLLAASIGPLFFAIAAQAPLIQRWFAIASGGRDPYALYAASNIGSFGGLLAYPLLVEPFLALNTQSLLWSAGYVAVFLAVAACALLLPRKGASELAGQVHQAKSASPQPKRVAHWIILALVPSGLMLATTSFLTTDIVAVPMLWVMPLGLYLLSFSIAFAASRWLADFLTRMTPVFLVLFGGLMVTGSTGTPILFAIMALALLFVVSVALHTHMYRLRPEADRLTGFYLAMSFGGVLGGIFAGLIAPVLFDWTYEYPILLFAAAILLPQEYLLPVFQRLWGRGEVADGEGRPKRYLIGLSLVVVALAAAFVIWSVSEPAVSNPRLLVLYYSIFGLVGLLSIGVRLPFVLTMAASLAIFGVLTELGRTFGSDGRARSYFGVYTVKDAPDWRVLTHGTTLHGIQLKGDLERQKRPTTYYASGSGLGQAMQAVPALYGPNARIGVVGLGTGTSVCYAQPGQSWRVFEIDPTVATIARTKFTFLSQCKPDAKIIIGDARLRLAEQGADSLDMLALDAFSSDAVPMHLLTKEAFATYGRVLGTDGLLLVHISNRHMALDPLVADAAVKGGWVAAQYLHYPSDAEDLEGETVSVWVAMSRSPEKLRQLTARKGGWRPIKQHPGVEQWTDDFASILPVMRVLDDSLP